MPEQLTKHPEVTLEVLRSAGAKCGEGAAQTILTKCPADRFCKLPGGEICVFGLADSTRMTQLTGADWQSLAAMHGRGGRLDVGKEEVFIGIVGIVVGAAIAILAQRRRAKSP